MIITSEENTIYSSICLRSLDKSWQTIMPDLEFILKKISTWKAAYDIYARLSNQTLITPSGLAEAFRNDLLALIPRFFGLTKDQIEAITIHFQKYHPEEQERDDLPGVYTAELNELIARNCIPKIFFAENLDFRSN